MKAIVKEIKVILLTILVGIALTACGGGGGDSLPIVNSTNDGLDLSYIGASWTSDRSVAVLGDADGNIMTVQSDSVVWTTSTGESFVIYYGNDGLPTRAVIDEYVIIYGNWTNSTVDIAIISPDGSYTVGRGIAVDSNLVSNLSKGAVSLRAIAAFSFSTGNLVTVLNRGGQLVSAAMCGVAIGSAIASTGITFPAIVLACASTTLTIGTELGTTNEDNALVEATGTTLSIISTVACDNALSCAGSLAELAANIIEVADSTQEGQSSAIVEAESYLSDTTATRPLNDTGITWGGNYPSGNNVSCIGETIEQQDCSHGRDSTSNDDSDGHAGFSYTKLDSSGNSLSALATSWDCVKDNVTGLIWEVKTDDNGLRDKDHTYTWYNSTGINDGGSAGTANGGSCVDGTTCDTEKFVTAVNAGGLCGSTDWRLPSLPELQSIVNRNSNQPTIDTAYFPNTTFVYWSSSPIAKDSSYAWDVSFVYGNNIYMHINSRRDNDKYVRLVRGGQ